MTPTGSRAASRRPRAASLCAVLLLAAAPARGRAVPVVRGGQRALFRVTHPEDVSFLRPYANDGFRQSVVRLSATEALVRVEARADPPGSRAPFPGGPQGTGASGAGLAGIAAGETAGTRTAWMASARLLALVGRSIEHLDDPEAPWDAPSVWRAREGSCVARANLSLSLLEAVGLEARAARGLRFTGKPGDTAAAGPGLLHRWVEVRIPDAGWVFSDPASTLHHVTARYLWLAPGGREGPAVDPDLAGTRLTLLELEGGFEEVDLAQELAGGSLRLRPAGEERRAAALVGRAAAGARVRLVGPGGPREARADGAGRFAFLGLPAGLYRLEAPRRSEAHLLAPLELRDLGLGR